MKQSPLTKALLGVGVLATVGLMVWLTRAASQSLESAKRAATPDKKCRKRKAASDCAPEESSETTPLAQH